MLDWKRAMVRYLAERMAKRVQQGEIEIPEYTKELMEIWERGLEGKMSHEHEEEELSP